MVVCGRADVELLDFLFCSFFPIIMFAFTELTSSPCLQAGWQMASWGGLLMRGLPSAAPQCEGRGRGWHPVPPSTSPGLREHPGFTLARHAAPLSLSQPSLNPCFTRSAFPIHWEKINKSNPQDLSLITSRLYLGLQLSCAWL